MGTVKLQIAVPEDGIADFCQRWQITELALFGSVLRDDFHSDSDVDVLVSFAPNTQWSLFDLVTMEYELEDILGREVDLVQRTAVEQAENYIRRKSILDSTETIYAPR